MLLIKMKDYFCTVLVIRNTQDFRIEMDCVVTIGTFDGLHLGHRKIIGKLLEIKAKTGLQTLVLTFDPHPRKVLFPAQNDLKLLTKTDEKLHLLQAMGVDICVVFPFSREFAEINPEVYIQEILVKNLKAKYLVIGYDHRFGKNRLGTIETLKAFSNQSTFELEEIPAQDIDSNTISSSKIRHFLEDGAIENAGKFLGFPYFVTGTVTEGKKLGRSMGYPTANIHVDDPEKLIPKTGVYFVKCDIENKEYYGMLNIGKNPTTDYDQLTKIEVNIFNFDKEIYHQEIRIHFLSFLRNEKKFDNLQQLTEQLKKDEMNCKNLINNIHA